MNATTYQPFSSIYELVQQVPAEVAKSDQAGWHFWLHEAINHHFFSSKDVATEEAWRDNFSCVSDIINDTTTTTTLYDFANQMKLVFDAPVLS
jgi:hypothetical protein